MTETSHLAVLNDSKLQKIWNEYIVKKEELNRNRNNTPPPSGRQGLQQHTTLISQQHGQLPFSPM